MNKCETFTRESWPGLMAQAQAGDRQAYTQLLKSLVPTIRTLAAKQIADEVLVEDVIQDSLLTLHRVRHTYDPAYPFLPWLMAIVSARAVDALRRRGRDWRWSGDENPPVDEVADSRGASAAASQDAREQLDGFLHQLPLRQREMVEYVHLRERSLTEAAAHHNLSVAAVKSLLHRALKNLRRFGAGDEKS